MVASRLLLKTFALATFIATASAANDLPSGQQLRQMGPPGPQPDSNAKVSTPNQEKATVETSDSNNTLRQQENLKAPSPIDGKTAETHQYPGKEANEPCPELPPSKSDSKTCQPLQDKDRQGADVANVAGDVNSCDKACKDNTDCRTWSWSDHNGGTCWLKSTESKLVNKPGVVSTECLFNLPLKTCTQHLDIDLAGQDIGNKPAVDASLCCDLCKGFDKCTAWSWNNYNGGTCWLKKNVGRAFPNPGVISSSIEKLETAVCAFEYDVDFVGNDIGNKPAKIAAACCEICKANADCKAYTWTKYNDGTCWMKSGKGTTISKPGAVSSKLA